MSNYSEYLKKQKQSTEDFYSRMYEGLGFQKASNKYYELTKRVNEDQTKVLVNFGSSHVFPTRYGYGLIVGNKHVVWLRDWQVIEVADWFKTGFTSGYQVLLNKDFYKVVESNREFEDMAIGECSDDSDFAKENGYYCWNDMLETAKEQESFLKECPVKFKI